MRTVGVYEAKTHLPRLIEEVGRGETITITKHGKPAGLLVGFASEDDWFDYKLEHDPRFLVRIARARQSLQAGKGVKLEDLPHEPKALPRRTRRST